MTTAEKAHAYDEALARAKAYLTPDTPDRVDTVSAITTIFPELAESKDEKIRKAIYIYLDWLDGRKDYAPRGEYSIRDMIAWLERQGEHYKFRNGIQVGDKVTRNDAGWLVNLSQLKRVAKQPKSVREKLIEGFEETEFKSFAGIKIKDIITWLKELKDDNDSK